MPFVQGYLTIRERGQPGNELPEAPVDPGFGGGIPPFGETLPEAPPGVWPPPSFNHPWVPIPGVGGPRPGHDLPTGPGHPDTGLPPDPALPGHELPAEPGTIWPPVTEHPPRDGKFWVVCGIPGIGWRYVLVDITQNSEAAEMIKPRGPLHWVETERTPPALGLAIVLAYALGVVLVLLAFVA